MFFVHQHKNDDDNDIKDIVTNIASFKDININDIKNIDYLLIDTYGTVISRCCADQYNNKDIINHGIDISDMIDLYKLTDLSGNIINYKYIGEAYPSKHQKNCRFLNNIYLKLWFHNLSKQVPFHVLDLSYLTEYDLNDTISKFKKTVPTLNIYALSPPSSIEALLSIVDQLTLFGINTIDKHLVTHWNGSIGTSGFLLGWKDSSGWIDKNKPGYFELNSEIIGKQIAIVSSDIDELQKIYKAYKAKYPQYIDKLKLYLYKDKFAELDLKSRFSQIEIEYCDCGATNHINDNGDK